MKNLNIKAEGDDTKVVVFWQAVQDGEHCVLQLGDLLTLHRPTHLVLGKRISKDNLGLCERIKILHRGRRQCILEELPASDRLQ